MYVQSIRVRTRREPERRREYHNNLIKLDHQFAIDTHYHDQH